MRPTRKKLSLTAPSVDQIYQLRAWARHGARADLVLRLTLLIPATIVLALLAFVAHEAVLGFIPFLGVVIVIVAILFGLVTLSEIVSDARTAARGDPLLLLGEVLRPPISGPWTERLLTDPATMTIDVTDARLVTANGRLEDVTAQWIGMRQVRSWGGLGKELGPGADVALLCSPVAPDDREGPAATRLLDVASEP